LARGLAWAWRSEAWLIATCTGATSYQFRVVVVVTGVWKFSAFVKSDFIHAQQSKQRRIYLDILSYKSICKLQEADVLSMLFCALVALDPFSLPQPPLSALEVDRCVSCNASILSFNT